VTTAPFNLAELGFVPCSRAQARRSMIVSINGQGNFAEESGSRRVHKPPEYFAEVTQRANESRTHSGCHRTARNPRYSRRGAKFLVVKQAVQGED